MRLRPWEFDRYAPHEFFAAIAGHNEDQIEAWRVARWGVYFNLVAQRGTKALRGDKIYSPQDIMRLPGDKEIKRDEVKREDFDKIFKVIKEKWTPPLEQE